MIFDVIYHRELVYQKVENLDSGNGPEYDVCEIQPLGRDFVLRNRENCQNMRFLRF